jgi:DNA invertase Pin-like site-specific DNA recombinase
LIVSLELPTSWIMMSADRDEIQGRIFHAINNMMLDVLAAIARKDYEDRRRRQQQGIAVAKATGGYGVNAPCLGCLGIDSVQFA